MHPLEDESLLADGWALACRLRWGDGHVYCPSCEADRPYLLSTRQKYKCRVCGKQFTPWSGSLIDGAKMPFICLVGMVCAIIEDGANPAQVQRESGCSYRTAHGLVRKVDEVLLDLRMASDIKREELFDQVSRVLMFMLRTPKKDKWIYQSRVGRTRY